MAVLDRLLVVCGVLLSLFVVSSLVGRQEVQLSRSETLYLPLAPVDPRSLVQGDFMQLRYALESELSSANSSGTAIVALDQHRVASFVRFDGGEALAENERRLDFVKRDWSIEVASRAYLFQEGDADLYTPAEYGIMALTPSGELALTGLADEELHRLGPAPTRW